MTNELKEYKERIFEDIKHIDKEGNEYWHARELMKVLEYKEWRNFQTVIDKAKATCLTSKQTTIHDFVDVNKIVKAGATTKNVLDYKLSRYACYLIVQNGDSRKKSIALGQTYFAIQTRRQEEIDEDKSNKTHYTVGKVIRNSIKKLGGTLPEKQPTPDKLLKEIDKNNIIERKLK